ncbi:MAG: hypothetical protein EXQ92_12920 [Alphaproteobacteria bacterium]|nr:hypothetical protein [Alphaproteobacteria bacterium]
MDKEGEILSKLDLVIDLARRNESRMNEMNARLNEMNGRLSELSERVARVEGRITDMPISHDFGHLEGRLDEISRRLPIPVGYVPPETQGKRRKA